MSRIIGRVTLASCAVFALVAMSSSQSNIDINFVELDTSKMIMTGENNYAICNHHFPSNWRSVSVNGDEITIATRDSKVMMKSFSSLTPEEKNSISSIKSQLMAVIRLGPFNVKSQTGMAKLTTFDKYGGSSVMGSGGGSSSSSSSSSTSSSSGNGSISISKTGKDSFIVAKPDFPFNWLRVFVNEDVDTIVYKDSRVVMLPEIIMRPDERAKMVELRQEVERSTKATEKLQSTLTQSFKNPMDFVNKALGGIFGK